MRFQNILVALLPTLLIATPNAGDPLEGDGGQLEVVDFVQKAPAHHVPSHTQKPGSGYPVDNHKDKEHKWHGNNGNNKGGYKDKDKNSSQKGPGKNDKNKGNKNKDKKPNKPPHHKQHARDILVENKPTKKQGPAINKPTPTPIHGGGGGSGTKFPPTKPKGKPIVVVRDVNVDDSLPKPVKPIKPKPTKPTKPSKPTKPAKPGKPTKPTTKPVKPVKPGKPTKPTKPGKPVKPGKPTPKPTKPGKPGKPTKPTHHQ